MAFNSYQDKTSLTLQVASYRGNRRKHDYPVYGDPRRVTAELGQLGTISVLNHERDNHAKPTAQRR